MNNFDQIERYLNEEMSLEEKESFEQAMEQDTSLAEEVRLQQFEESAIDLMIEDDLLGKINKIASEEKGQIKIVPLHKKKDNSLLSVRWLKIAAVASILLVTTFYFYTLSSSDFNPRELAITAYEKRIPNFSNVRTIEGQGGLDEYDKYSAYITNKERQKMEETIRFFKTQKGSDALYKIAHAYLLSKDFDAAIEGFITYQSTASETERDYLNASFYLALAHLGKGEIDKAQTIFIEIKANPNHLFQKDAEEILMELKKQ